MSRSAELQSRVPGRALGGRYELAGLIGSGGFADVYKAHDRHTDSTVAIKVLYEHLARDPEVVRRFAREARVASQIVEPHVVRILDTGFSDGIYYMVMKLVEGETLFKAGQRYGAEGQSAGCIGLGDPRYDAQHLVRLQPPG